MQLVLRCWGMFLRNIFPLSLAPTHDLLKLGRAISRMLSIPIPQPMYLKSYASDFEIHRINKMFMMLLDLVGRILRWHMEALTSRKYKLLTKHSINIWMSSLWSPWKIRLYLCPWVRVMVWNFIIIILASENWMERHSRCRHWISMLHNPTLGPWGYSKDQSALALALLVVEKHFSLWKYFRLLILSTKASFFTRQSHTENSFRVTQKGSLLKTSPSSMI